MHAERDQFSHQKARLNRPVLQPCDPQKRPTDYNTCVPQAPALSHAAVAGKVASITQQAEDAAARLLAGGASVRESRVDGQYVAVEAVVCSRARAAPSQRRAAPPPAPVCHELLTHRPE